MKDFKEQIDDFIFRRLEVYDYKECEENKNYNETLEKIRELLNTEEKRELFDKFEDALSILQYKDMKEAYKKGFRDGMELFNMLNEKEMFFQAIPGRIRAACLE